MNKGGNMKPTDKTVAWPEKVYGHSLKEQIRAAIALLKGMK